MVEGSFYDQVDELAQYLDTVNQTPGVLSGELAPLAEREEKDEMVRKLVNASSALSQAPEKEFIPSYNLLIHLVRPSPLLPELLPIILNNLSTPPPSSPINGPALVLSILTTIFNVLPPTSKLRSTVLQIILKIISAHGLYEVLNPQLKNLDRWFSEWNSTNEEVRSILVAVADIAEEASDYEQFYNSLLSTLHQFSTAEASSPAARTVAVRLVKAAISLPNRLDFDDLIALDSVQALAKSDPELFNLLEVFAGGDLEDYEEFNDINENWLEDNGLSHPALLRKIRLLTLASLSTRTPTRSLPYKAISKALHIPSDDVEMWVIDVIRAGLVEGKLSQLNQTFLIHRSSYRVFGLDQWLEVSDRLEVWKGTLRGILDVIRASRESVEGHAKGEREEADRKLEGVARAVEVDA
ncbi:PCI-domain-containing protein [Terfezia boudieri ATCC MYA-4762]|uniref:Eukaryotic translation initiation factor 3 subunit M n=1 Tax=Terfezia boudieri ATCC MYA-4762 TaxID=1051890 RepID=A0A3N4LWQ4_9PEZI|nr:PCI-domain-containing protein [Terfezia boudieri ATCC MYA-4762]